MKKLLSGVLAAATVLSMSAVSFAAASDVVDKDGKTPSIVSGAINFDAAASGEFDVIAPDQTMYALLGATNLSDAGTYYITIDGLDVPAALLGDSDCFRMSTKDKKGDASKLIKIYQEDAKTIDGVPNRNNWLKIVVGNSMTSDELKGTMTLEFKPQKDLYKEIYKKAKAGGTSTLDALGTDLQAKLGGTTLDNTSSEADFLDQLDDFFNGVRYKLDLTFWVNNEIEDGSDADRDAGDAFVFNPESNEENLIIWDTEAGERAALKFDADDDADKFYAKLSIKSNSSIYSEYGDPVGADLWFYDFVGAAEIPSTSRATLTLGIPWDDDDDYIPSSPEDCYIYRLNYDGTLEDVTDAFTYDADGDIDGWHTRTRELGTFIVSDMELDIDVAGAEEVVPEQKPATPDKVIPNTGSSDMVNVAVAGAVISLAVAGAVAFRKAK